MTSKSEYTALKDIECFSEEDSLPSETLDKESLVGYIYDCFHSCQNRLTALRFLWNSDEDWAVNTYNVILKLYLLTPVSIWEEFIYESIYINYIPLMHKADAARTLHLHNPHIASKAIIYILRQEEYLPLPLWVDLLRLNLENISEDFIEDNTALFNTFLTNPKHNEEFRYKTLVQIQRDESRKIKEHYISSAYQAILSSENTDKRYIVFSAEYILQKQLSPTDVNLAEVKLLSIAENPENEYNLRADASDTLVRSGSSDYQKRGRAVISELATANQSYSSVYSNRQNVHNEGVDESVKKFILILAEEETKVDERGRLYTFEQAKNQLHDYLISLNRDTKVINEVNSSLLRIQIDQALYPGQQTLQNIFTKIWSNIMIHQHADTLKERMVEELVDMAATCSSGHLARLVNVFSGFDFNGNTFTANIGWKEQIRANFYARLQKIINSLPEDELEGIVNEMQAGLEIKDKPVTYGIYVTHLSSIQKELREEFLPHISLNQFEDYFREAIVAYEEGVQK